MDQSVILRCVCWKLCEDESNRHVEAIFPQLIALVPPLFRLCSHQEREGKDVARSEYNRVLTEVSQILP